MRIVGYMMALMLASPALAEAQTPWRAIAPENLLVIDTDYGRTVIELNPEFAPNHVQRIRDLAAMEFYDGLTFYRVIEGFVAQAGRGEGEGAPVLPEAFPALLNENDRASAGLEFAHLGSPDLYAKISGHVNGFYSIVPVPWRWRGTMTQIRVMQNFTSYLALVLDIWTVTLPFLAG